MEVEFLTQLVDKVAFIRLGDILWQVGKKGEGGGGERHLGGIFYLDELAFDDGMGCACGSFLDDLHALWGRDMLSAVVVYFNGFFDELVDALFFESRDKEYGHICQGAHCLSEVFAILCDVIFVFFDEVPLVDG